MAREQTQARLRAIIETMAEGLIVQDAQGTIIECNPAACSILGVTAADLIGKKALGAKYLGEDQTDLPECDFPDRIVMRAGKPLQNVTVGLPCPSAPDANHQPAAVRWLLLNASPLAPAWPDFRPRIVTTFRDITAQRQTLEAARRPSSPGGEGSGVRAGEKPAHPESRTSS
jgi:PAS domain-containing protein